MAPTLTKGVRGYLILTSDTYTIMKYFPNRALMGNIYIN
jgi:hypothetical protein